MKNAKEELKRDIEQARERLDNSIERREDYDAIYQNSVELDRLILAANPNLGPETTADDVLEGLRRLTQLVGPYKPIRFLCASQSLAHFVAVQSARTVFFALAFFAVLIAWYFASHALDLVAKLPVLSTLNRWGGGAVGLCRGALLVLIALWLFRGRIPPGAEEHTFLLPLFLRFDPLALLVHATRA